MRGIVSAIFAFGMLGMLTLQLLGLSSNQNAGFLLPCRRLLPPPRTSMQGNYSSRESRQSSNAGLAKSASVQRYKVPPSYNVATVKVDMELSHY